MLTSLHTNHRPKWPTKLTLVKVVQRSVPLTMKVSLHRVPNSLAINSNFAAAIKDPARKPVSPLKILFGNYSRIRVA